MEFPELGVHCGVSTCRQLDFLPARCDACAAQFCQGHLPHAQHECPKGYTKDAQVPVCPLCGKIIPKRHRDDAPDLLVSAHIDSECQSDPAKEKRKAYENRCQKRKCKKKELVPIRCLECRKNFCLSHRHAKDHECEGKRAAAAEAAQERQQQQPRNPAPSAGKRVQQTIQQAFSNAPTPTGNRNNVARRDLQGTLTEDEALARALAESMQAEAPPTEGGKQLTQEELDRLTALALQEDLNREGGRSASSSSSANNTAGNKSCNISWGGL